MKNIIKNIRSELGNYIECNNIKSLVIGISGGIDSALCTVLASSVCTDYNISLIGRSIPIESNKEDEIERADKIGKYYCTDFKEIDLTKYFESVKNLIDIDIAESDNEMDKKIRMGNIKARLRMIYLYELASKYKGMVLSTDNYTELLLGFWTLHGDVGDFGMIQNLWKTEVYELAKYFRDNGHPLMDIVIKATPTDGLGITKSDLDQLDSKSYEDVDIQLKDFLKTGIKSSISERYIKTKYKRENPYNIHRDIIMKGVE